MSARDSRAGRGRCRGGRGVFHREGGGSAGRVRSAGTVGCMPRRSGQASPAQLNRLAPPPIYLARDHLRVEVETKIRTGEWEKIRPGAYIDSLEDVETHARRRLR